MMNWFKAQTVLGIRSKRKIGNNTWLESLPNGDFGIKLHKTFVVIIHCDNTWTLNSGGWRTVTTKQRINEYAPGYVSQKNFEWFMQDGSEFFDGITVNEFGNEVGENSNIFSQMVLS